MRRPWVRELVGAVLIGAVVVTWATAPVRADTAAETTPLADERAGFTTRLTVDANAHTPVPTPPAGVLDLVTYPRRSAISPRT